ncbi:hypothetical protein BCR34DRAFT_591637 [Clohesyomyces aquaticus]|uniref:Uncharacterized protein n=1 Tax=Clohesyomyces aquaticus TaxID=1231657 RepID=A0A1Y1YYU5_9PLEO|nr:hypothetical protein BCR34DRAFT_591637 [Clohesyomyces aquaticus]
MSSRFQTPRQLSRAQSGQRCYRPSIAKSAPGLRIVLSDVRLALCWHGHWNRPWWAHCRSAETKPPFVIIAKGLPHPRPSGRAVHSSRKRGLRLQRRGMWCFWAETQSESPRASEKCIDFNRGSMPRRCSRDGHILCRWICRVPNDGPTELMAPNAVSQVKAWARVAWAWERQLGPWEPDTIAPFKM